MKLYVCACNGWNPFDDHIKMIPEEFWAFSYNFQKARQYMQWKEVYEPHGELVAHIANPEAYKQYAEFKRKTEEVEKTGGPMVVTVGNTTYASTNYHFDPNKGLVDEKGTVIVDKDTYLKNLGLQGVM